MAAFLRLALLCVFTVVLRATDDPLAVAIGHAKAHPQGDVPASFVAEDYRGDLRDLPIGVFNSCAMPATRLPRLAIRSMRVISAWACRLFA